MTFRVRIDQRKDLPITLVQGKKINFRYTFYRSQDTRKDEDVGQDYVAINSDNNQIAFSLCDGVSQSFFGDLAANIIGNELVDWFWLNGENLISNHDQFQQDLIDLSSSLLKKSNELIDNFSLPDGIPSMLSVVLEKKRSSGSESMFVAGYINAVSNYAAFAWIGDCRLRAWEIGKGNLEFNFGKDTFQTKERWSSKKGIIGNLHTKIIRFEKPFRVIAYSDGLSRMDKKLDQGSPSNKTLEKVILENLQLPASDDVSFIEIHVNKDDENLGQNLDVSPQNIKINPDNKSRILSVSWKKVESASSYDIAIKSRAGLNIYSTENIFWEENLDHLPFQPSTIKVRAWINQEVTEWSKEYSLENIINYPTKVDDIIQPENETISQAEIEGQKNKKHKLNKFNLLKQKFHTSFIPPFKARFSTKIKNLLIFFFSHYCLLYYFHF